MTQWPCPLHSGPGIQSGQCCDSQVSPYQRPSHSHAHRSSLQFPWAPQLLARQCGGVHVASEACIASAALEASHVALDASTALSPNSTGHGTPWHMHIPVAESQ